MAINTSGLAVIAVVDDTNNGGSPVDYPTLATGPGVDTLFYNMNTQAYTLLPGLRIYDGQDPYGSGTQFGGHGQAINDSGQVVGELLTSSGGYDAAIWQNGTLTDLNTIYGPSGLNILPAGFTLNNATAIDNNGDIAGYGTDAAGNTNQAFVIYAPMPGDANLDGRVDINDLTIVLSHYGQTGMTWTEGEFTGDGTVDINDLTIVLAHYNDTTTPAAGCSGRRARTVHAGAAGRRSGRTAGLRPGQAKGNVNDAASLPAVRDCRVAGLLQRHCRGVFRLCLTSAPPTTTRRPPQPASPPAGTPCCRGRCPLSPPCCTTPFSIRAFLWHDDRHHVLVHERR